MALLRFFKHVLLFFSRNCTGVEDNEVDAAFGPLVWVWLLSMFKVRMCVFSMVVCLLWIRRESFKLTTAAKVCVCHDY